MYRPIVNFGSIGYTGLGSFVVCSRGGSRNSLTGGGGQNSSKGGGVRVQVRGNFHIGLLASKKKTSEGGGGLNPLTPPPSGSATV